jgi:hypothetical protein
MKLEVTQVNSTQNQGKSEILKPVFLPGVYRPAVLVTWMTMETH